MSTAAEVLRVGLADNGRPMTLEEFLECEEEEGYRYELARGILDVSHVPNDPHGYVVCNLTRGVAAYDLGHPGLILRFGEPPASGSGYLGWSPDAIPTLRSS